jgi:hypothetical protein
MIEIKSILDGAGIAPPRQLTITIQRLLPQRNLLLLIKENIIFLFLLGINKYY